MLTSLFSLFYVTGECYRFLHQLRMSQKKLFSCGIQRVDNHKAGFGFIFPAYRASHIIKTNDGKRENPGPIARVK